MNRRSLDRQTQKRSFLKVSSDADYALVVSWAFAALRNRGPKVLFARGGEQGLAKTRYIDFLEAPVDPNTAPRRALPRNEHDLYDRVFAPWEDDVFADFEKVGRVKLNPQQRRDLHVLVEMYVARLKSSEFTDGVCMHYHREWLDRLIKSLDHTIKSLDKTMQILVKPSGIKFDVFRGAGLLPTEAGQRSLENEIARLKSLRDSCVEERKKLGQPGPKPRVHLNELLRGLEFIFRDAGGAATGISRSDDERESRVSPFIDFAFEVLLRVPESIRPRTHQALAAAWERARRSGAPRCASCEIPPARFRSCSAVAGLASLSFRTIDQAL